MKIIERFIITPLRQIIERESKTIITSIQTESAATIWRPALIQSILLEIQQGVKIMSDQIQELQQQVAEEHAAIAEIGGLIAQTFESANKKIDQLERVIQGLQSKLAPEESSALQSLIDSNRENISQLSTIVDTLTGQLANGSTSATPDADQGNGTDDSVPSTDPGVENATGDTSSGASSDSGSSESTPAEGDAGISPTTNATLP